MYWLCTFFLTSLRVYITGFGFRFFFYLIENTKSFSCCPESCNTFASCFPSVIEKGLKLLVRNIISNITCLANCTINILRDQGEYVQMVLSRQLVSSDPMYSSLIGIIFNPLNSVTIKLLYCSIIIEREGRFDSRRYIVSSQRNRTSRSNTC